MAISKRNPLPAILFIAGVAAFFWFGFSSGQNDDAPPVTASRDSTIDLSDAEVDAVAVHAANSIADEQDPDPAAEKSETATPPKEQRLDLSGQTATASERQLAKASGGVYDLTFDDVKFDLEADETFDATFLTDEIRQIDGQPIRIRGYIKPSFSQRGLKSFVFVRDNKECCFGPSAALYDCMLVKLKKGAATDYTVRPVTIEGTFYLKDYKGPDGNTWAIYRMKDAEVK